MSEHFQKMIEIGTKLGAITDAHMYHNDFITIEGKTAEGKEFSLSLHIEEEKNDGN